jgi:hypothetical protein
MIAAGRRHSQADAAGRQDESAAVRGGEQHCGEALAGQER